MVGTTLFWSISEIQTPVGQAVSCLEYRCGVKFVVSSPFGRTPW